MKLRSYTFLFSILSFLSDKTNGASFFVKYKLLLGTLIIGLISTSGCKSKKEIMCYVEVEEIPIESQITCYDSIAPPKQDNLIDFELKGTVKDKYEKPLLGVTVKIKNSYNGTIANEYGEFKIKAKLEDILVFSYIGFKSQEIKVSDLKIDKPIILEESDNVMCYEVIVVATPSYIDDIYTRSPKKIDELDYKDVQIPPVSPIGNLDKFQRWVESNIQYSENLKKIKGELILGFTIDKKGKIVNKKVLTKLSPKADAEALRVLSSSKIWTAGIHNGKSVKTKITIPVNFQTK